MPSLVRVELWDRFQADGGAVVTDIPDLLRAGATRNVEQPDQESFTFSVPVTSLVADQITPRRVVRPVFSDGTFDEWRLNDDTTRPLGGEGAIECTALPPIFALAECGLYYTTGAGGIRDFAFSMVDATPSAVLTALVLGTPDCPAWFALGTIDPSVLITIEGSYATPLQIALAVRDAVRSAGLPCELRAPRNGTTQYLIDLVTQVGSAAAVPEIRASKQMLDYALTHACTRQATRVIPRGPVDATGSDATLARARFIVTAVNGGTKRITVADEAGGSGPIKYDDQYVSASPVGWFVFRERTGRTFQILHTYKATQEIELADVSDFAAHSVTAPEWIGFRLTEALNGTRRVGAYNTQGNLNTGCPYVVTAVDGGTKKLTLANQFTAPVSDPVSADGEHVDWVAARAAPILTTSSTGQTAGVLTCGSVTGVAVDDIVILSSGALPSGTMFQEICDVTAVDAGPKTLTLVKRYSGGAPDDWGGSLTVYVYRPVATTHLITASAAAANTITVDAVGTAAADDIVETITQPCQGTMPYYVDSPDDVASYGKKIAVLGRPETGDVNGVANSCMRVWATPSNPPDGWTHTVLAGSPTHSQENTITRQGGHAWRVELARNASAHRARVRVPVWYPHPIDGAGYASVRLKCQLPLGTLPADGTITITCRRVDRAGATLATPTSWTAPAVTIGGPAHSTLPDAQKVQLGTWIDLAVNGLDVSRFANEGIAVDIDGIETTGAGTVEIIIDGAQWTQTATAPHEEPELLVEFADATRLLQAGNLELLAWAGPPVEFSMSVVDIEAIDPTLFAEDKLTIGGTVRAIDPDRSVDLSLRLMQWSQDYLQPEAGQLTLATLPTLITDLVRGTGAGSAGGGSVTASAVAVGGQTAAWEAISGKPATFPPSAHAHYWRDLLSEVAGEGPRVGVARLDSSGAADITVTSGSPGAATDIAALGVDVRTLYLVSGQYNQTDAFFDLVLAIEAGAPADVGAIAEHDVKGAPRTRVYTAGASTLKLSLTGGGPDAYAVRVLALAMVTPA